MQAKCAKIVKYNNHLQQVYVQRQQTTQLTPTNAQKCQTNSSVVK